MVCYYCGAMTGNGALCARCKAREASKGYGGEAAGAASLGDTVKRADIFGNVHDTHRTEAELNGWAPKQGALL